MDEHPPSWKGNGARHLAPYGLGSVKTCRMNLYAPFIGVSPIPPVDATDIARGLVENFSLTQLEIHRRGITPDGMVAVAQALSCNKYLEHIGLGRNTCGFRGGVALGDALRVNQTLRTLDLGWADAQDDVFVSLADMLLVNNSLQRLLLDRNRGTCDGVGALAAAVEGNRRLKTLSVSFNKFAAAGCSLLGKAAAASTSLVSLDVSMNGVSEAGIFSLVHSITRARSCPLQTLNISYNVVGDTVALVGQLILARPGLRELSMEGCRLVPGDALRAFGSALRSNKGLVHLSLAANDGLGDAGLRQIAEAAPLEGHGEERCPLRYLDLADTALTAAALEPVAAWVAGMAQLHTLHLSRNRFADATAGAGLAEVLNRCTAATVGLIGCKIGPQAAEQLAGSLRYSKLPLRHLVLRQNGLGDGGFLQLLPVLLHHGGLSTLDVADCGCGEESFKRAADLFRANDGLQYLVLADDTVLLREDIGRRWAEVNGARPPAPTLPLPVHCDAPMELPPDMAQPSWGFATYSVAVGSAARRPHEHPSLHRALFQHAGRPVRHCALWFGGSEAASVPQLGNHYDHRVAATAITRMENAAAGVLVTDDQMRREFNMLDTNGNGYLDKEEFRGVYEALEPYGVNKTRADVEHILTQHAGGTGRISFDQFCVIFLKLIQQ